MMRPCPWRAPACATDRANVGVGEGGEVARDEDAGEERLAFRHLACGARRHLSAPWWACGFIARNLRVWTRQDRVTPTPVCAVKGGGGGRRGGGGVRAPRAKTVYYS